MSDDQKDSSQADGKQIIFPNIAELWKELYFKTEGAWADAFKEFVSTDSFVKMLDQGLSQHLSIEKITRQNVDTLFEQGPAPSKKDLARIAELVISVEEKVDNLDYQLVDNIGKIAESMLSMLTFLDENKKQTQEINDQIVELKKQNMELKEQIMALEPKKVVADVKNTKASPKGKGNKKNISPEKVEQAEPTQVP